MNDPEPMKRVTVPDIEGPTVQLCYIQTWDLPHPMARCDRAKGHGGMHTWELTNRIAELEALLASPVDE